MRGFRVAVRAYEAGGAYTAQGAHRRADLNRLAARIADDFALDVVGDPQEIGMDRVIFYSASLVGASELKRTCIETIKTIRADHIFGLDPGEPRPPRLGFGSFSLGESLVLA